MPVGGVAAPKDVCVTAGPDRALDSPPGGDDRIGGSGYETRAFEKAVNGRCLPPSANAGERCVGDDQCQGGVCAKVPARVITRVDDVESPLADDPTSPIPNAALCEGGSFDGAACTSEDQCPDGRCLLPKVIDENRKFWAVSVSPNVVPVNDVEATVLHGGDDVLITFVEDKDADGLFGIEESSYGSSDRNPNSDGCYFADATAKRSEILAHLGGLCVADRFDTLSDPFEVRKGWVVRVEGKPGRRVFADPARPDSDGDGLMDDEECALGTDARQADTDADGVSDFDEIVGYAITDRQGNPIAQVLVYLGTIDLDGVPAAPHPARMPADPACADPDRLGDLPYATDPTNPDTDGDLIADGAEAVRGFNPNDPSDGANLLDTDEDGIPDAKETAGFDIAVNGVTVHVRSDFRKFDTDGDHLPDALEWMYGSDPSKADTDGDGISDLNEFAGPETCTGESGTTPATFCSAFAEKQQCNFVRGPNGGCTWAEFVAFCGSAEAAHCSCDVGNAPGCGFTEETLAQLGSLRLGTNLVRSDSDLDGLGDAAERMQGLNPLNPDTDDDGTADGAEATICIAGGACRDPKVKDRIVGVRYTTLDYAADCDSGDEELVYYLYLKLPGAQAFREIEGTNICRGTLANGRCTGGGQPIAQSTIGLADPFHQVGNDRGEWKIQSKDGAQDGARFTFVDHDASGTPMKAGDAFPTPLLPAPTEFLLRDGQTFELHGYAYENDGGKDRDINLAFGPSDCRGCDTTGLEHLSEVETGTETNVPQEPLGLADVLALTPQGGELQFPRSARCGTITVRARITAR